MTLQETLRPVRQTVQQAVRTYPLQHILAPKPWAPSLLYFDSGSAPITAEGTGPMRLEAGQRITADGYFNCVYLAWWIAHTDVHSIGIQCRMTGSLVLRVIGHLADKGRITLLEQRVTNEDPAFDAPCWAWDRDAHANVLRLHVEVQALSACTIEDISFVTQSPPLRDVSLSVGLCTLDREGLLADTIAELVPLLATEPSLRRIILVNQGQPFRDPGLRALRQTPGLLVVRQPNRGGTGGFTRTMIETLNAAEPVTHHLVMDDDIRLDARIIGRAVLFLGHCTRDVALGGHSIELEDRMRLHEAGAMVGTDWLFRPVGSGVPLGERESLELWNSSLPCDYNGWWFCILPVAAMRQAGLPAPFFLHGDDVEYGLRLKAAGVPTVPLPGLGVWHSSFLYKHAGVIRYYDLRNLLIMASFHPQVAPRPGVLMVLGWIMSSLLVHRYRAALACLIAVEDFLAGPEVAFSADSGSRNRKVRDLVHALPAPEVRTDVKPDELGLLHQGSPSTSIWWQTLAWTALFLSITLVPGKKDPAFLFRGNPDPASIAGRSYLLALDPEATRCFHMRPRRLTLIRLTVRALSLALRYGLGGKRAAARWQAAMPVLCSRDRWAQEFGQDRV